MLYLYLIFFKIFNLLYYQIYLNNYKLFMLYNNLKKPFFIKALLLKLLNLIIHLILLIYQIYFFNYYYLRIFIDLVLLKVFKLKLLNLIRLILTLLKFHFIILIQINAMHYNKIIKKMVLKETYIKFKFQYYFKFNIYYIIYFLMEFYNKVIINLLMKVYNLLIILLEQQIPIYLRRYKYNIKEYKIRLSLSLKFYIETKKFWKIKKNYNLKMLTNFWYYRSKRIIGYNLENLRFKLKNFIKLNTLIVYYYHVNPKLFLFLQNQYNLFSYYFFLSIKYSKSFLIFLWKSDIIYKILKALERKKW